MPLDTPNKTVVRRKDLGNYTYDNFEHLYQMNNYYEIGWLLLIKLDKMGRNDVCRDSNCKLEHHKNDL